MAGYPTFGLLEQLSAALRRMLDSYDALMVAFLSKEHNDDGTHPFGIFTDVPYNALNFTASSGAWGVDFTDQVTYCWEILGQKMTVLFEINTTDVTAAAAELSIAIPNGRMAARRTRALVQVIDAGAAAAVGVARVNADGTAILIQSTIAGAAWTITAADNTSVRGQITFPIKATS